MSEVAQLPAPEPHVGVSVSYRPWTESPVKWEFLSCPPKTALQRVLWRIQRGPRQVAFRTCGDNVDIYSRLPDVLDDEGKPAIVLVLFAVIFTGISIDTAKAITTQLKDEGWVPAAVVTVH